MMEHKMAGRRKNPEATKEVARLREEYLELIREGMGREGLSPEEERVLFKDLEENITDVFMLAAKVRLAEKLGIVDWLKADLTGTFPEKAFPGQE